MDTSIWSLDLSHQNMSPMQSYAVICSGGLSILVVKLVLCSNSLVGGGAVVSEHSSLTSVDWVQLPHLVHYMWVEFVVDSHPCFEGFLRVLQ